MIASSFGARVVKRPSSASWLARWTFCLAVAILGLAPACATIGGTVPSVPFRVETNVPDATVWVDDQLVGSAASLGAAGTRLRTGFHRVEIRHPTHYSFFKEIDPKGGDDVLIRAELHELVQ